MKKKLLFVVSIIAGILILISVVIPVIIGTIDKAQASIGVIGGADGPTSVVVAGVIGTFGFGSLILRMLFGVLLIVIGIWWIKKNIS